MVAAKCVEKDELILPPVTVHIVRRKKVVSLRVFVSGTPRNVPIATQVDPVQPKVPAPLSNVKK